MPDISIQEKGFADLRKKLFSVSRDIPKSVTRCHQQMGMLTKRTAVDYAPKSPTQAELNAQRKTRGRTYRKARAYSRPSPGGLMRSIQFDASEGKCIVYVAANSDAGKYAKRIHDGKGKTWFRRGKGTVAKGAQADEKFISRAIDHHHDNGGYRRIIQAEIDRFMK